MMEYNDGGLKEEGGGIDPVSGNEVPPGALAEEVRDDIPAQLSEGEFVFPADVVRYIGLEKLMMMRQQAKEGLMRMDEMGQMSNAEEATIEGEPPAEYFDIPDNMEVPQAALVLEMNQGGAVKKGYKSFDELMGFEGGSTEQTGYDIVEYVNDQGRKILVVEVDGVPTNEVPSGYTRGEVRTEDGAPVDAKEAEEKAPAVQQQQPRRSAPLPQNDDDGPQRPEDKGGSTIVTGGFHNSKRGTIEGGTKWSMERGLDGSVTLNNSQYGEVTLSPEEAANLQLGSGTGGMKGNLKDAFSNPFGNKERQTGILSTGVAGDPAAGNQVHKALVERAEFQKAGEEFVKGNTPKKGLGDTVKDFVMGGGITGAIVGALNQKPTELEGNIAQILGKTSDQFTKADFATIGMALAGKSNTAYGTALGTASGIDQSKFTELTAFIDAVSGKNTSMMSGQVEAAKSGKVKTTTTSKPSSTSNTNPGGIVAGMRFNNTANQRQEDDDDYQGGGTTFNSNQISFGAGRTADDDYDDLADSNVFADTNWNSGGDDDNNNNSGGGVDWSNPSNDAFGGNTMIAKGGLLNKKKISSRKKKKRKGLASKK